MFENLIESISNFFTNYGIATITTSLSIASAVGAATLGLVLSRCCHSGSRLPRADKFRQKYGPWAIVAGASEGLGKAYATALASLGLNLVLIARRAELLEQTATELRAAHPSIEVRTISMDLANSALVLEEFYKLLSELEVGLVIYNACATTVAVLTNQTEQQINAYMQVNVVTPTLLSKLVLTDMQKRGRGGLVLMSSLAAQYGSYSLPVYASSKAYLYILAETLWDENRDFGIDVLGAVGGAIATPNFKKPFEAKGRPSDNVPGLYQPEEVAAEVLSALGSCPSHYCGRLNRFMMSLLYMLFTRKQRITLLGQLGRDAVKNIYV